ncbi:Transcriptional regulator, TetR family [Serinicoccus hydrothermalis]|uniref:Transcriptional regulator, TetR family n=1 Tax=Serinicoccus hydrothermalis TaxID=1758689 RepID=A0A1B1NET5_9MICO|nr:TetR/AcrR family transcriptional regulator [Serinicoccus hydrothermalis]ANS79875.1 Transcriptional regulator, TetR family [Serinicoccus hydrothermalis]
MGASPRILDAALDVVATRGLEATSVRTVAAAAEVSVGAVQHHFSTKADLLLAAMDRVAAGFQEEIRGRLERAAEPREALREALLVLACAHEEDSRPARVWAAFAARAAVDPGIGAEYAASWQQLETFLAELVEAVGAGESSARERAALLLALVDGLAIARAAEPGRMPAGRAGALVDAALDGLG